MSTQTPPQPVRHIAKRPAKRKRLVARPEKPGSSPATRSLPQTPPVHTPVHTHVPTGAPTSIPDRPASAPANTGPKSPCDACQHAPQNARPAKPAAGDTNAQLDQLEQVLSKLADAQNDLTDLLEQQHQAMTKLNTGVMDNCARRQESLHRRVMQLEHERRSLVLSLATAAGLPAGATLRDLADAYAAHAPERRVRLLELRDLLRKRSAHAAKRGRRCGRVAGSVLGSINTALRLLTRSCIYNKSGDFQMPPR
ncbi:MAG: flagellar export chaperone FlgN, partial [Planctomycetota bacterium]